MATSESWGVNGIPSTIEHHQTMTAILNIEIETLTALKDTLGATPIKSIFESATIILTLVRVRLHDLFQFLQSLISNTVRTR